MAVIISGTDISKGIRAKLAQQISETRITPHLAVILVGNDPASEIYVTRKAAACKEIGISSTVYNKNEFMIAGGLPRLIKRLNADRHTHGILVQLPLPPHIDRHEIFSLINPIKDVDVFNPENVGLLQQGRPRFLPCTPHGIVQLLQYTKISVDGKHVVVINRSDIVGKPLAAMLSQNNPEYGNATVTLCHDHTPPGLLRDMCLGADIIVVAVGIPGFLTKDMVQSWQTIIDVGITRQNGKIVGDVAPEVFDEVAFVTPVPGGVGPLTIASLLMNTVKAFELVYN